MIQSKRVKKTFYSTSIGLIFTAFLIITAHAEDCEDGRLYFRQALALPDKAGDISSFFEKESLYRKAIELCPEFAEAYHNLGDVYQRLGRFAEAIANFSRAAELNSNVPQPCFGLGDTYFKAGNYREAVEWYDRGLKLAPNDALGLERKKLASTLLEEKVIPQDKIVEELGRMTIRSVGEVVKMTFGSDSKLGLIPFDVGKYEIRDDARPQLNELGKALQSPELSQYMFQISGHTDSRGSDALNLELSIKRAMAVKKYLMDEFQIPEARLTVKGYGKHKLIAPGNDEASHAVNRRVEIERIGKNDGNHSSSLPKTRDNAQITLDVGFLYQNHILNRRELIKAEGTTILRTGKDPYQVFFRPYQDCYAYLLQKDSDGKWHRLFPEKDSDYNKNPVKANRDYWVPGFERGFLPEGKAGEESIYILAASWQIDELESSKVLLAEVVVPITGNMHTRGVKHIGKPEGAKGTGKEFEYSNIISQVQGQGGLIQSVSFTHR